jgi:hypothetical protein
MPPHRLPRPDRMHHASAVRSRSRCSTCSSTPFLRWHSCISYLVGDTIRGSLSLAGYQLLWKALPIARSEETTVTAQ